MEVSRKVFRFLVLAFFIIIPIVVGLFVRFDDLSIWNKNRERFFYKDRALFTSYDAFYFARWGLDYLEGKYRAGEVDPLRFVPDNYIREKLSDKELKELKAGRIRYPSPIPMESFIGAVIAKIKGTYIENISIYLTPILAVFFVIPLVLYLWEVNAPIAGFSGAIFSVVSLMYLARTTIARFDTDALNLFFPFTIAYLFYKALKEKGRRRYIFASLAGIFCQLFNWWYAHPDLVLIMFLVFVVGVFADNIEDFLKKVFKKSINTERRETVSEKLKLIGVVALFSNPLILLKGLSAFWGRFYVYVLNFGKTATHGDFPNVLQSISEAQRADIKMIILTTAGNPLIFYIGMVFVFILFFRKWRQLIFLIPVFLLGLMTFKSGNRFAMYLAPFVGMGFGYLFDFVFEYFSKDSEKFKAYRELILLPLAAFFVVVVLYSQSAAFKMVATPKITPSLEEAFINLQKDTSEDAWIWTWWDYGTAIQYLGRRAVFHDGQSQFSPKTYFVATTFSTSSPEQAYNTISGISNKGVTFINKWLEDGKTPEEIRDMYFSGKFNGKFSHPVYWIFTEDEIPKFAWINYFGTWDFGLKRGVKKGISSLGVCVLEKKDLLNCSGIRIDLKNGVAMLRRPIPLNTIAVKSQDGVKFEQYNSTSNVYFEVVNTENGALGFIMEKQPFFSMFNQMYILRNYDKKYFTLIKDQFPVIVVYKVNENIN